MLCYIVPYTLLCCPEAGVRDVIRPSFDNRLSNVLCYSLKSKSDMVLDSA